MPFLSYSQRGRGLRNAGRFLKEAGAEAVRLEGGRPRARNRGAGSPRSASRSWDTSGSRRRRSISSAPTHPGQRPGEAEGDRADARALAEAGPSQSSSRRSAALAAEITREPRDPDHRHRSGAGCDGQILVTRRHAGLFDRFRPRFVRRYADLGDVMRERSRATAPDVKKRDFPSGPSRTDILLALRRRWASRGPWRPGRTPSGPRANTRECSDRAGGSGRELLTRAALPAPEWGALEWGARAPQRRRP